MSNPSSEDRLGRRELLQRGALAGLGVNNDLTGPDRLQQSEALSFIGH